MFQISAIPAFSDNYIWCVHDQNNNALIIDPGCAKSVEEYLHVHNLKLVGILITHHHPDHIGGVNKLIEQHQPVVYGFERANMEFLDRTFSEGQTFSALGIDFTVLEVPGHTLDHIAYYAEIPLSDENIPLDFSHQSQHQAVLFCGDALFSAGCGRLFEGTAEQMYASLAKLTALPQETLVYCAHEYTLSNLKFAATVMPENKNLSDYLAQCRNKRQANLPTIPTSIRTELAINPFLRCTDPELIAQLKKINRIKDESPVEIFRSLRRAKDNF